MNWHWTEMFPLDNEWSDELFYFWYQSMYLFPEIPFHKNLSRISNLNQQLNHIQIYAS